jgi:hypothetical protein
MMQLLVSSRGFLDEAVERARNLVEGYEMWDNVIHEICPHKPVILATNAGDVLAVSGARLEDANKPALTFQVNETVSIKVPYSRPRKFVAA